MGYSLFIGEASPIVDYDDRTARMGVEVVYNDSHANWTYDGYSAWTDFTRRAGLHKVFFAGKGEYGYSSPEWWWRDDEGEYHEGLMDQHPGAFVLSESYYREFVRAKERLGGEASEDDVERIDFLIKWTRWALDNCKYPTFCNS